MQKRWFPCFFCSLIFKSQTLPWPAHIPCSSGKEWCPSRWDARVSMNALLLTFCSFYFGKFQTYVKGKGYSEPDYSYHYTVIHEYTILLDFAFQVNLASYQTDPWTQTVFFGFAGLRKQDSQNRRPGTGWQHCMWQVGRVREDTWRTGVKRSIWREGITNQ